jgi:hypothetical protein
VCRTLGLTSSARATSAIETSFFRIKIFKRTLIDVDRARYACMIGNPVSGHIGVEAHCRRVTAFCNEIALSMKLPLQSRVALQRAARTHHDDALCIEATEAMLRDCREPESAQTAWPSRRQGTSLEWPLQIILEMADQFDEEIEFAPYADEPLADRLSTSSSPAVSYVLPHLRRTYGSAL